MLDLTLLRKGDFVFRQNALCDSGIALVLELIGVLSSRAFPFPRTRATTFKRAMKVTFMEGIDAFSKVTH
jgi:hypothetical protein